MDNFEELTGKTLVSISFQNRTWSGKEAVSLPSPYRGAQEIHIKDSEGNKYLMYHEQDCCEGVWVEDVVGDVEDVINTPIIQALEHKDWNGPMRPDGVFDEYYKWTYYELRTIKGSLHIRWYGESNGYYAVDVGFGKMED